MAEARTCEFDDRKHYAKGLCFPHYRKLWKSGYVIGPPKPRRRRGKCKQCGGSRPPATAKPGSKLCLDCRYRRTCKVCGSTFQSTLYRTFCDKCRFDDFADYWQWWSENNRDKVAGYTVRRKALKLTNGRIENFTHQEIFDRDDWTCGICGDPVTQTAEWPDPGSASLDHIVPLSQGGEHTRANVRCTHLHCNTSRGVGTDDQPLQLVLV